MKRLLLIVALLVSPVALFAQAADRDILLTSNGTLYTIESRQNDAPDVIDSPRYLALTIQNGQNVIKTNVPASITGGNNWEPALAFDSESNTLFVFWLHSPNTILGANELLFCPFQNGKWGTPTSVEDVPYHFRYNLRVGVTRSVQVTDSTGTSKQIPGLTVHAAWWDDSAASEGARYAMLTIDKGIVTDIARRDLIDFINTANLGIFSLDDASKEILRHPIVFESSGHDTIDVVFGDMLTNTMHRLTLKPVLQSRVRIPIGVRDTSYPAPRQRITADAHLGGVASSPSSLALYYMGNGQVRYLTYENGAWSGEKTITLTNEVSADAAVAAIRRMVSGD
ncbi:MAG TPA: hypothetical protein VLV78_21750 [Thermoanaerobaculia bacterium]|nr:hypothetical protein [Thermoanaerobaculia bacterium]